MLSKMHDKLLPYIKSNIKDSSRKNSLCSMLGSVRDTLDTEDPVKVLEILRMQTDLYKEEAIQRGKIISTGEINRRLSSIEREVIDFYARTADFKDVILEYHLDVNEGVSSAIRKSIRKVKALAATNGYGNDLLKLKRLYQVVKQRKALYALRFLRDRVQGAETLFKNFGESVFNNYEDYLEHSASQGNKLYLPHFQKRSKRQNLIDYLSMKKLDRKDYTRLRRTISEGGLSVPLRNGRVMERGYSYNDLSFNERKKILDLYEHSGSLRKSRIRKTDFVRLYGLSSVNTLNKIISESLEQSYSKIIPYINQSQSNHENEKQSVPEVNSIYIH